MKLQLLHKPDKSSGKDPLIVHVEYGAGEDSQGNKIPAKKHIDKVAVGQIVDVPDQIGYAILGRYHECFKIVQDDKPKVEKQTKEVAP